MKRVRGRRRRWWLVVPLVLVVGAAGGGAWLLTRDTSSAAATTMTSTASTQTVQSTVAASGTIEPARSADLDFEVSGTVTGVFVSAGDTVQKGQVLARVDTTSLVAARSAASASLTAATEQLDQDEDDDASDTQLAADQTAVVAAQATLDEAEQAVADAALRATISGTVAAVDLEVGDVVGSSSQGSSGDTTGTGTTTTTSAVSIVATRDFIVSATVSSADVASLRKGLQAEVTATGSTDTVYGTVQDVGLVAETSSAGAAVFPVTIAVTGKQKDLYAGTSAEAAIIVSQREGVLSIASRALQTDGDTTYVDKVVDGRTVRTTVEIGEAFGMTTEVVSGLAEGDVVELPGFTTPAGGGGTEGGGGQQFPGGGELPGGGQFPAGGGQAPAGGVGP